MNLKLLLQISTVAVFLGRGYQHLFWDAPYRALLWDEEIMSPIIQLVFGYNWTEYINNLAFDDGINWWIKGTGIFYLICALVTIFIDWVPRWIKRFLLIGATNLIFLAILLWKEKFYSLGQFFEYTLQFSLPVFFYWLAIGKSISNRFLFWLKAAVAITFICHGLYAVGYYPQPGYFMQMTIDILGVSDGIARLFLKAAGILDFVVAGLIFFPKTRQPAFLYMMVWGFLTALARIFANLDLDFFAAHLHQNTYEFVYRFCHFLVPLGLYFYYKKEII